MQCPHCQESVAPRWRFCPRCGGTVSLARIHERRHVSVVFVDLVASTKLARSLESNAYFDLMGEILTVLAAEIEAHGGEVLQFQGDAVLAAFGANDAQPETNTVQNPNQESHALRALRAAQASLEAIEAFGKRAGLSLCGRAGVDTDLATTGWVSGEFTVFGNVVNHSRRLCSAAEPGRVFVSTNTRVETEFGANFEEQQVHIRDYSDEGHPHRLETLVQEQIPTFIGREKELATLHNFLQEVQTSKMVQRVEVVGPVGIGKTSLIEQFALQAEQTGLHVIRLENKNVDGAQTIVPDAIPNLEANNINIATFSPGHANAFAFSLPGFLLPQQWAKQMAELFTKQPGLILEPKQPEQKLMECLAALQQQAVPVLCLRESGAITNVPATRMELGPLDAASSYVLAQRNTQLQKRAQGNPWLLKVFAAEHFGEHFAGQGTENKSNNNRFGLGADPVQVQLNKRLNHLDVVAQELLALLALCKTGLSSLQLAGFSNQSVARVEQFLTQLKLEGWVEEQAGLHRFQIVALGEAMSQRLPEEMRRSVLAQLVPPQTGVVVSRKPGASVN